VRPLEALDSILARDSCVQTTAEAGAVTMRIARRPIPGDMATTLRAQRRFREDPFVLASMLTGLGRPTYQAA